VAGFRPQDGHIETHYTKEEATGIDNVCYIADC